jgi:hypothetical protein
MSDPLVVYHALGGGFGHAVRALSLARQAAKLFGGRHLLQVNTGFAPCLAGLVGADPRLTLSCFDPAATPEQVSRQTLALLRDARPALLVVDTFPRGVGGELAEVLECWSGCPRVLVSRGLPADYVARRGLRAFVARHFDLVLAPGEPSPFAGAPGFEQLPPFTILDQEEMPGRPDALRLLGAPAPAVLVAGSGSMAECQAWQDAAADLAARWPAGAPPLRLALPPGFAARPGGPPVVQHFPLMACLAGVRVVLGNAGYHLVHETRAAGVAGVFVARARQYDDQAGRLAPDERVAGGLLESVLRRLAQPAPAPAPGPNGAARAAARMAALIGAGPA